VGQCARRSARLAGVFGDGQLWAIQRLGETDVYVGLKLRRLLLSAECVRNSHAIGIGAASMPSPYFGFLAGLLLSFD